MFCLLSWFPKYIYTEWCGLLKAGLRLRGEQTKKPFCAFLPPPPFAKIEFRGKGLLVVAISSSGANVEQFVWAAAADPA